MADNDIIDFYKKADNDNTPDEPLKEQTETPESVVSKAVIVPVPDSNDPFDKFLYNLADKIKDSKPVIVETKEESEPQDEPFNKFLLELADKLQSEKVITKQQQETLEEQVKQPISTDPDEDDPFKSFIGSFANILKQDELINREENIKEATINFINKLKEQPEEPFIIKDEIEVKPKVKPKKYLPSTLTKKSQKQIQPTKQEEPVVQEQSKEPINTLPELENNSYVKELKQADKNKLQTKKDKTSTNIKSVVEKQVAEILSRYPNLGFTGGGGGTNAVQYAEGGTMNGNLTVNGTVNATTYLSGGVNLYNLLSSTGGGGSQTLTFTESAAQLTISNGNTVSLSSLQSNYIYTNTSQNVLFNRKYAFDTSSFTLTATLPESPQIGDEIEFFDIGGAWSTNSLIINSSNYIEQRLEPINCNVRFGLIKLIYTNNSVGWRIIPYPRHDILPIFAPDVSIQVDVSSGFVPLTINFTGINNLGQEIAPVTTWIWNMTGGNTPQFTTQNVTYTYQTSGTYIANLTAINSVGIDTTSITVSAITPTLPTSGLFVWFNADSGVATSGSAVTSWTDQQNGVVAAAFNGPTLLTNQLNGRNAISFDGSNDYFTGTFGSSLANGSARTFVIIGKYNTMPGQTGMFDGSSDLQAYIFQNSGNLYYNNGPQIGPVTGNWTANYFIQIINTASNGFTTYRVNGVNRVSGTMNRPVMTGFNIGRRGSSSEYANCNIVELLVYNRSLTTAEMQQIETYANVP